MWAGHLYFKSVPGVSRKETQIGKGRRGEGTEGSPEDRIRDEAKMLFMVLGLKIPRKQ